MTVTLLVIGLLVCFFVAELRASREILLEVESGRPPRLTLAKGKRWHVFLSHNWDNQDAVATIKRQLQLLLPDVAIFLDVDDLVSIEHLEAHVEQSASMLVLLGSERYFRSANCLRELEAAKARRLRSIRVHGRTRPSRARRSRRCRRCAQRSTASSSLAACATATARV